MRITVATESGVRELDIDGLTLFDALEEYLGVRPAPKQVSVSGAQLLTEQCVLGSGSFVVVTSAAIANKGATGRN